MKFCRQGGKFGRIKNIKTESIILIVFISFTFGCFSGMLRTIQRCVCRYNVLKSQVHHMLQLCGIKVCVLQQTKMEGSYLVKVFQLNHTIMTGSDKVHIRWLRLMSGADCEHFSPIVKYFDGRVCKSGRNSSYSRENLGKPF